MAETKNKKEATFFEDYLNLQKTAEALKKTAENPFFKSKYVQLKDVLVLAKDLCGKNNFIFIQKPFVRENGIAILQTKLIHKSKKTITAQTLLPCKDPNDPQKYGGAITYMRRYSLTSILGLEEDDDDGNASAKSAPKSDYKPKPVSTENQMAEELRGDDGKESVGLKVCPVCDKSHDGQFPKCLACWKQEKGYTKTVEKKTQVVNEEEIPF